MILSGSVIETEIFHVVEFDGLQLLAVQQPVAERHSADKLPAGHHPHHRVVAADLHVCCRDRGRKGLSSSRSRSDDVEVRRSSSRVLTGSDKRDAEVRDGQQLRCVDAISSQQLHVISRFSATRRGPLRKSTHGFMTSGKYDPSTRFSGATVTLSQCPVSVITLQTSAKARL